MLGSACSAGGDLPLLCSRQQQAAQPTSQTQPGTFCSFSDCSSTGTRSLWLSAGGARTPGHRLCCSSTRSQRGLSKLGGQLLYGAARTSQTGCLRELSAGELSISCQLVKPFSGQSCQQAGRAARGGCREARPWCSVLQAACPCTAGIEWAWLPTSPDELGHQARAQAVRCLVGSLHSFCKVYISPRKEEDYFTACLHWS